MARIIDIARIEHRRDAGETAQHGGLQVIHHNFGRHAQHREGLFMAAQEVLHGLRHRELDIHLARVTVHHHEKTQSPARRTDTDGAMLPPVHLGAFTFGEGELQIRLLFRRPDAAHVGLDDGQSAAVADFPQPLQDLLGTELMRLEPAHDLTLVGVQLATAQSRRPLFVALAL